MLFPIFSVKVAPKGPLGCRTEKSGVPKLSFGPNALQHRVCLINDMQSVRSIFWLRPAYLHISSFDFSYNLHARNFLFSIDMVYIENIDYRDIIKLAYMQNPKVENSTREMPH